jgi:hypothetical protein
MVAFERWRFLADTHGIPNGVHTQPVMVHLLDLVPGVIRDVANYVTFFQVGSARGAAKPCQASSPKKNADLRMKIGAVFR